MSTWCFGRGTERISSNGGWSRKNTRRSQKRKRSSTSKKDISQQIHPDVPGRFSPHPIDKEFTHKFLYSYSRIPQRGCSMLQVYKWSTYTTIQAPNKVTLLRHLVKHIAGGQTMLTSFHRWPATEVTTSSKVLSISTLMAERERETREFFFFLLGWTQREFYFYHLLPIPPVCKGTIAIRI